MCPQHGAPACPWCRAWNRGVAKCSDRGPTGHAPAGAVATCLPAERGRTMSRPGIRRLPPGDRRAAAGAMTSWLATGSTAPADGAAAGAAQPAGGGPRRPPLDGRDEPRHKRQCLRPPRTAGRRGRASQEMDDGNTNTEDERGSPEDVLARGGVRRKRARKEGGGAAHGDPAPSPAPPAPPPPPETGGQGSTERGRTVPGPRGHPTHRARSRSTTPGPPPSPPTSRPGRAVRRPGAQLQGQGDEPDGRAGRHGEWEHSPRAERAPHPQSTERERDSRAGPPPPPLGQGGQAEGEEHGPGARGTSQRGTPPTTPPPPPRGARGGRLGRRSMSPRPRERAGASTATRTDGQGGRVPKEAAIPPHGRPAAHTGDAHGAQGDPPPPPVKRSRPRAATDNRRRHPPGRGESAGSSAGHLHPPKDIHHRPRLAGSAATAGRQGNKPEGRTPVRPSRGVHRGQPLVRTANPTNKGRCVPMPIYGGLFASAKCPVPIYEGLFGSAECSQCPCMGGFLPVQSVAVPIYGGLFGSAECPHAHIWGAFWQCKVSPCPYMGGFLAVKSVPMPMGSLRPGQRQPGRPQLGRPGGPPPPVRPPEPKPSRASAGLPAGLAAGRSAGGPAAG